MNGLKLSHWNGTSFKVYNRFTKKTIGRIIDEIDWRFVDEFGNEYKLPSSYNKFCRVYTGVPEFIINISLLLVLDLINLDS